MQKDFHYCAIKTLAIMAGFKKDDAQTIAYASQYVDDATEWCKMSIENPPDFVKNKYSRYKDASKSFDPICTAHKGLQFVVSMKKDSQLKVYIPFHFLPAYEKTNNSFDYRVYPNGQLAQTLVDDALNAYKLSEDDAKKEQALVKLGIALHSYADTFSHQRFSGRKSKFDNDIERIKHLDNNNWQALPWYQNLQEALTPYIGHAEAFNMPDRSDLTWQYEHDATDVIVTRINADIFLEASHEIYNFLIKATNNYNDWKAISEKIRICLTYETDEIKKKFRVWKDNFPDIDYAYSSKTWRRYALGEGEVDWDDFDKGDFPDLIFSCSPDCDLKWFYFHFEAYNQRKFILDKIPQNLR